MPGSERATYPIVNLTRGGIVCEHAEIAATPLRRLIGLLGRSELPAGTGMLIHPAPSIHSAFMRFDFDAVFLDRDMRVVRLAERIGPWQARSARRAKSVLELSCGEIERRGLEVGDELAVQRTDPAPGEPG
jgi:uncharacterized membrane protein (UPF0127 family)